MLVEESKNHEITRKQVGESTDRSRVEFHLGPSDLGRLFISDLWRLDYLDPAKTAAAVMDA